MSREKTGKIERYRVADGREFTVEDPFYLGSCDYCGWVGSTEEARGEDDDVICPKCFSSGADCGRVAEGAVLIETIDPN